MANILIKSNEANAAATALTFAARNHRVCLLGDKLAPGVHDFSFFGADRSATLHTIDALAAPGPRVAIVFGEGEDVPSGIAQVLDSKPDLLVVIGGNVTAAVEAVEVAQNLNFDVSRILTIGAFLVGGNGSAVRSEKRGVLAGFLSLDTPEDIKKLAATVFPQITLGDAFEVALSSVNALFHLPPMILNAMSVERGDDVRFYVEAFGESVCNFLLELDADRCRLGAAMGRTLLPIEDLNDRYSGDSGEQLASLREKVNTPLSTQSIKLPSSFHHRFLAHEVRSFFAPLSELARRLQVDVPTIDSAVRLSEILVGSSFSAQAKDVAGKFLDLIGEKPGVLR